MRNVDDLRRALDAETADLVVHIAPDRIRRRAEVVRLRRTTMAAAAVLAAAAVAVPSVVLASRSDHAGQRAGDPPGSTCAIPSTGPSPSPSGNPPTPNRPMVATGTVVDGPAGTRYEILLGLAGPADRPEFAVGYRDVRGGPAEIWDTFPLGQGPDGGLPSEAGAFFVSYQLVLGANRVLNLGLYSRAAHRITVAADGRTSEARTASTPPGWTFFWVERQAGSDRLTIVVYDATGVQHTVAEGVHLGLRIELPGRAPSSATPSPSCPPPGSPDLGK